MLGKLTKKVKNKIFYLIHKAKIRERRKTFGYKNADKTYYIIRRESSGGIFSILNTTLGHINYAISHQYIPVVDITNLTSNWVGDDKGNAWEFFFEQPGQTVLDEVYHSKHVILSNMGYKDPSPEYYMDCLRDDGKIQFWHNLYKKYIHFTPQVNQYILTKEREILGNKKNVLGVLCRGTDYTGKRPGGHPVQPELEEVEEKVKETAEKFQCDALFLATEDVDILNFFKNMILDIPLIYIETERVQNIGDKWLSEMVNVQQKFQMNMDYIAAIHILTKCSCFLAGRTSGSVAVYYMKEGVYDYVYFWDKGYY